MKSIVIDESCLRCGLCASIAPDVFEVLPGEMSHVKETANLEVDQTLINQAIEQCPVQAISWGEEKLVIDDREVTNENEEPTTTETSVEESKEDDETAG
jgi:ferredoxin